MGERWGCLRKGAVIMLNRHDVVGNGKAVNKIGFYMDDGNVAVSEKGMWLYIVHVTPYGEKGVERDDLLRDLYVRYAEEEMSLPETKKIVEYIYRKGVQEKMYEYIREYFAEELAEGRAEARAEARAEGFS